MNRKWICNAHIYGSYTKNTCPTQISLSCLQCLDPTMKVCITRIIYCVNCAVINRCMMSWYQLTLSETHCTYRQFRKCLCTSHKEKECYTLSVLLKAQQQWLQMFRNVERSSSLSWHTRPYGRINQSSSYLNIIFMQRTNGIGKELKS